MKSGYDKLFTEGKLTYQGETVKSWCNNPQTKSFCASAVYQTGWGGEFGRGSPDSLLKKLDGEIAIDMVMQFFKNECDARARACNKDTCDQLPV